MQNKRASQERLIAPILRRGAVFLSLLCFVSTVRPSALAQEGPGLRAEGEIDIPALLREAQEKTAESLKSRHLLENAPMAVAYTRMKEGYWFWRFGRFDCDRLRAICKPIEDELHIEAFDYVRFNVDAEMEKINAPEKSNP